MAENLRGLAVDGLELRGLFGKAYEVAGGVFRQMILGRQQPLRIARRCGGEQPHARKLFPGGLNFARGAAERPGGLLDLCAAAAQQV